MTATTTTTIAELAEVLADVIRDELVLGYDAVMAAAVLAELELTRPYPPESRLLIAQTRRRLITNGADVALAELGALSSAHHH